MIKLIDHLIVSVGTSLVVNGMRMVEQQQMQTRVPILMGLLRELSREGMGEQGTGVDSDLVDHPFQYLRSSSKGIRAKDIVRAFDVLLKEIEEEEADEVYQTLMEEILLLLEEGQPGELSAELSTIFNIGVDEDMSKLKVTLLASDTGVGKFCADVLQAYFEGREAECELKISRGLSYGNLRSFERGLISYTNLLISTIESALVEKEMVGLVVTGGFKAQVVYSAIIAMLYRIPIIYYNELFSDVVILPPIPLKLDRDFWMEYKEILLWFEKPRTEWEIRKKWQSIPSDLEFFLEKTEEKKRHLSALGRILIQIYNTSSSLLYI